MLSPSLSLLRPTWRFTAIGDNTMENRPSVYDLCDISCRREAHNSVQLLYKDPRCPDQPHHPLHLPPPLRSLISLPMSSMTFAALYSLQGLKTRSIAIHGSSCHPLFISASMTASKVICATSLPPSYPSAPALLHPHHPLPSRFPQQNCCEGYR